MLSNYHSVLQVSPQTAGDRLERAWQVCRARFMRLTAKGPLRFYRHDLLKQADCAYKSLCGLKGAPTNPHESFLGRQVRLQGGKSKDLRVAVKSQIRSGNILGHKPRSLESPKLDGEIKPDRAQRQEKAKIEDDFCLEVLYRLEGDLLRFSCRRELLGLAERAGIHAFRANMLMAQIVESVRKYKLYEPSEKEIMAGPEKKTGVHRYRGGKLRKLVLGSAMVCILIDIVIIAILIL